MGAGVTKSERTSSGLVFEGDTLICSESKFAQLSAPDNIGSETVAVVDCCVWGAAAVDTGSGTASKSINDISVLISVGLPLEDAKLLEDTVLCREYINCMSSAEQM